MDKKKRYLFLDLVRVFAALSVVYYHMVRALDSFGIRQLEQTRVFYSTKNLNIGTVGVGLFFMVSGAGLMCMSKDKEHLDVLGFYKKRILRIFVPFYAAYVLCLVYKLATNDFSFVKVFGREVSPVSFILTLIGFDGYISQYGVHTYYLLGEWFLGALIVMYLLFPFIRGMMLKNKWITILVATIYFVLVALFFDRIPLIGQIAAYRSISVKIYEFILGMFLILIVDSLPKWICFVVSIPLIGFYLFYDQWIQNGMTIHITVQNVAFFLLFMGLEGLLLKLPGLMKKVRFLGGFTYEMFLVHHVVIHEITMKNIGGCETNKLLLKMFAMEFICVLLCTALLWAVLHCKELVTKLGNKEKW